VLVNVKAGFRHPREVAPGLFAVLPAVATFTDVDLDGALYDVEMTLDMTDVGIRPTSVQVTAQEGSPPVSGTTLRSVRVRDLAGAAIFTFVERGKRTVHEDQEVVDIWGGELPSPDDITRLRLQGPSQETLGWVAYFYNMAGILGLPPARQVERSLGLPRTTASKWVRRARERGLIDDGDSAPR